jgi:quercetin dioxygenase-like cupin family protein
MTTTQARPYIAQAVEHQQLEWIGGSTISVLLDGQNTGGQLTLLRTALRKGDASPVHVHGNEDEMFVVLKGSGIFWVGEDRYEVGDGGVVFLPREIPHAYRFTSDVDLLTLCTRAGIEGFFRAAGHYLSLPRPEGFAVTPGTAGAALAAHGGRIVGPPKTEAD